MTPPKGKVSKAIENLLGPLKTQKIDFLKNGPRPRACYTDGIRTSCTNISLCHQLSKFSLRGGVCITWCTFNYTRVIHRHTRSASLSRRIRNIVRTQFSNLQIKHQQKGTEVELHNFFCLLYSTEVYHCTSISKKSGSANLKIFFLQKGISLTWPARLAKN